MQKEGGMLINTNSYSVHDFFFFSQFMIRWQKKRANKGRFSIRPKMPV